MSPKLQHLAVNRQAERTDKDAEKEHVGDAQGDTEDAYLADGETNGAYQADDDDGPNGGHGLKECV